MKTKKILFGIGMAVISISSLIVKAQDISTTGTTSLTNDLLSNITPWTLDDVHKIAIRYCNKEIKWDMTNSYLTINMRPGETKDLCVTFINTSEQHQDLTIGFTESIINSVGKQLCNGDLNDKENAFYKMIYLPQTSIGLSGNNWTFTQTARIRLPKTATWWNMYGCIGFLLSWAYFKWPNDVLGIRVARNFPMKITVTWDVYNLWRRDDIKDVYTINKTGILKALMAILAIRLLVTIFKSTKKKETTHKKK